MPAQTFSTFDLRFLLSRVHTAWLVEEQDGLAPLGPTGIRKVQGVANNNEDPNSPNFWFGAADTLFKRLTFNRLLSPGKKNDVISAPFANSLRGPTQIVQLPNTVAGVDQLNVRNISNLISDVSNPIGFQILNPADPDYAAKWLLKQQDDPKASQRLNPQSGLINPLPYSNWTGQFGQFFDHGLDFVSKGVDGRGRIELLPSDSLYSRSVAPGSPAGTPAFITASRNNTVNVTIGEGSSDALVAKMGLATVVTQGTPVFDRVASTTTQTRDMGPGNAFAYFGTLVLNDTIIDIAAISAQDLINQINTLTPTTGVTASLLATTGVGTSTLVLTPALTESFNLTSPFIDLSQNYGSDDSRFLFLREYLSPTEWTTGGGVGTPTVIDLTSGRLLSAGATVNGLIGAGGLPNWTQTKANAAKLGIILHDKDISAIPLVAFDDQGNLILDANGLPQLVALNKVTGDRVYVKDTNLTDPNLILATAKHAFLNDMAPFALAGATFPGAPAAGFTAADYVLTPTGDNPANYAAAMQAYFTANNLGTFQPLGNHFLMGDGRGNENIGLTAVHEVFLNEHNRVLELLKTRFGFVGQQPAGGWSWTDPLTNVQSTITGEDLLQMAKLVSEMNYQHMVFDQFARKLSPNVGGFVLNPAVDARISSEFANAVYRLGHSMMPDTLDTKQFIFANAFSTTAGSNLVTVTLTNHGLRSGDRVTIDSLGGPTGLGGLTSARINGTFTVTVTGANTFTYAASGVGNASTTATGAATDAVQFTWNKDLISAFLAPTSYTPGVTAGEIAQGSSDQVGMRIDEKVADALRDNLLGRPLDLASLNLFRGRDAGLPTLNEMRGSLQSLIQTAAIPTGPLNGVTVLASTLTPYTSWSTFRNALKGTAAEQEVTVKNFIMAYASDAILTQFGTQARAAAGAAYSGITTLAQWYALRDGTVAADQTAYINGLRAAANAAAANATFMGAAGNKDFNRIDAWIGGLAEREVTGGMLGSTFNVVFAITMVELQNGDSKYYLGRVPLADFFNDFIEGNLIAHIVMRATGAKNIYTDIFSTPDNVVEMGDSGQPATVGTLANLQASTTSRRVFDANGNLVGGSVGRAGFVGTGAAQIFYGNPGNYVDARNVLNANGVGNASEVIAGRDLINDRISALGGNDAVYAYSGNDTVDGGSGVDYLHGGDGNDSLVGGTEGDFMYGEAGNDIERGGIGIDVMFGNEGADTMFGGIDGDIMNGGIDADLMYGGDNVVGADPRNPLLTVLDPEPLVSAGAIADDIIKGGDGNDTIFGGGGFDNIEGNGGHDILVPGSGGAAINALARDVMNGNEGDDIYIVERDVDFINMDFLDTGLAYSALVNKGAGFRLGNGLGIDEVRLTQNTAATFVLGITDPNSGAVQAFSGIERIVIGTGFGNAAVTTGTAAINIDAALVGPGIFGEGLEIVGNAGTNDLIGTDQGDTLNGGGGVDTLTGLLGNDTFIIDNINDVINEIAAGGLDTVVVQANFNYTLTDPDLENLTLLGTALQGTGNDLDNVIIGNASNNVLTGLAGDDSLQGNGGQDTLIGGVGIDVLSGGADVGVRDVFLYSADITEIGNDGAFIETITDFEDGVDVLNLSAIDGNINLAGNQGLLFLGTDTAFTAAGQLVWWNGVLYGNVDDLTNSGNLDLDADFRIAMTGLPSLSYANFAPSLALSRAASLPATGVNEGNGTNSTQRFRISLGHVAPSDATFTWSVSGNPINGAAADAADFVAASGTATVAAGTSVVEFDVSVVGDTAFEANEDFDVTLTGANLAYYNVTSGSVTSTIINDDLPVLSFSNVGALGTSEGTTGTANPFSDRVFRITLSNPTATARTINWAVTNVPGLTPTLNAADFGGTLPTGQVTIAAGATTADITVRVTGDQVLEADEAFGVTLTGTTQGALSNFFVVGNNVAYNWILNDDATPSFELTGPTVPAIVEGNTGSTNHTYTVTLGQAAPVARTFTWTASGTGITTADLVGGLLTGTVTVAAGATSATFNVGVLGDLTPELNEVMTITMSGAALANYAVVAGSATSTIVNDDINVIALNSPGGPTVNADNIVGTIFDDQINLAAGNDIFNGLGGNDTIIGNGGSDTLTGGAGNDVFQYTLSTVPGDSPPNTVVGGVTTVNRDTITDFVSGTDRIDLSQIDAIVGTAVNDAFTFIGANAFTALGQVRFQAGILQANFTGNNTADLEINLRNGAVAATFNNITDLIA